MIIWTLAEFMHRYKVTTKELAHFTGWPQGTVAHLRQSKTLPAMKGARLESLITGLENAAHTEVKISDLIERVE